MCTGLYRKRPAEMEHTSTKLRCTAEHIVTSLLMWKFNRERMKGGGNAGWCLFCIVALILQYIVNSNQRYNAKQTPTGISAALHPLSIEFPYKQRRHNMLSCAPKSRKNVEICSISACRLRYNPVHLFQTQSILHPLKQSLGSAFSPASSGSGVDKQRRNKK